MARKKFRRKARSFFKRGFRRRSNGGSESLLTTMLASAIYGAVRPKVEVMIAPYTSKIPFVGAYTDEVALGALGFALAKGKVPFLKGSLAKSAGKAILIIEAARVGSGVSQGISVSGESNNFDSAWG